MGLDGDLLLPSNALDSLLDLGKDFDSYLNWIFPMHFVFAGKLTTAPVLRF